MAMPIDPPPNERILVTINEVDVANRVVHARDKMDADLQISWRDTGGSMTAVPTAGERWTARREGYIWYLENRLATQDEHEQIAELSPGDLALQTTGDLYLQADGDINLQGSTVKSETALDIRREDEFVAALQTFHSDEIEPRFQLRIDGRLEWSGDGVVFDASLYRQSADVLGTDNAIQIERNNPADNALVIRREGESTDRFRIQTDGRLLLGDGNVAPDVEIYRQQADVLESTDSVWLKLGLDTTVAMATYVDGDTEHRLQILANGEIRWSDGSGVYDVVLTRGDAGLLQTPDAFSSRTLRTEGDAPLTPATGEMRFDDETSTWLFWNKKFWQPMSVGLTAEQNRHIYLHSDFTVANPVGGISAGDMGFQAVASGTGATIQHVDSSTMLGSPVGVVRLDSGSTATGTAFFATRGAIIQTDISDINEKPLALVYTAALLYIDVLSTAAQEFFVGAGVTSDQTNIQAQGSANGWGFRYSHGLSGGAWQCNTYGGDGGVTTRAVGETVVADKWYLLETLWDRAGGSLSWWIDHMFIFTLTGIIPGTTSDFPSSSDMRPYVGLQKTAGTTERTLHLDAMTFYALISEDRAGQS